LTNITNLLEGPRTVAPLAAVSSAASDVEYRYGADFTLDEMRELDVSSTLGAADDLISSPRTDTAG
jgi:hypothetical protein